MKKLISALLITGGIAASFGAHADPIVSGGTITGGDAGDCVLLGENVTLNLSKDVSGAYVCEEPNSEIKIATCHKSGSRKPLLVDCVRVGDAEPAVYAPTGCTPGEQFEIADYRGFTASSRGGGVATEDLGGACTDATVEAIIPE